MAQSIAWPGPHILAPALVAFVLVASIAAVPALSPALADDEPSQKICGFTVGHAILAKWQQMAQNGTMTCAVNAEVDAAPSPKGTTGRWAQFLSGNFGAYIIVANMGPNAGTAFEVHSCIWTLYNRLGSTGGVFGFPTSDEHDIPGGRESDFEGGVIMWDAATSECSVHINKQ